MANDDQIAALGGLRPLYTNGNIELQVYKIRTSSAGEWYKGQPVVIGSDGRVTTYRAMTNTQIGGAIVGILDSDVAGLPTNMTDLNQAAYLDANKDGYAIVATDPDQLFIIQEDTGGTALTEAAIGQSAMMVPRTASGNTVTGACTWELDRSTIGTGTDGTMKIVGLSRLMNSDGSENDFGNYAKLIVKANLHQFAQGQGGLTETG